ncbi:hypothetical protein [Rhizobium azibense]|uniref:Uncharacterized protein n=1 Tax=Rhizobium azibense TaxID=1136135 RepID=A0A4R3RHG8_9HYPH|nr:hypothetical protein [Rhizobium azibense]TCU34104.1 hypothetical protein EV129_11387 [Rhizobium azibense]
MNARLTWKAARAAARRTGARQIVEDIAGHIIGIAAPDGSAAPLGRNGRRAAQAELIERRTAPGATIWKAKGARWLYRESLAFIHCFAVRPVTE